MDIKDISIIMPVLNFDKYLIESILSVLEQSYISFELLIVTDDFVKQNIVDHLNTHKKFLYITFIFAAYNIDSGTKRNLGIKQAQGKYIAFLDSDDFFYSKDSLSKLFKVASKYNSDVVGGSCVIRDDNKKKYIYRKDLVNFNFINETYFKNFQNESGFYRFIYKSSFIKSIENFPILKRFQDSVFMVNTLSKVESFYLIPDIVYIYRKQHKVVNWTLHMYLDHLKGVYYVLNLSINKDYSFLTKKMLKNFIITNKKRCPKSRKYLVRKVKLIYLSKLLKLGKNLLKYPFLYFRMLISFL